MFMNEKPEFLCRDKIEISTFDSPNAHKGSYLTTMPYNASRLEIAMTVYDVQGGSSGVVNVLLGKP